jgi:hypothetical protein
MLERLQSGLWGPMRDLFHPTLNKKNRKNLLELLVKDERSEGVVSTFLKTHESCELQLGSEADHIDEIFEYFKGWTEIDSYGENND